ncbi:hypothetical protein CFOL_v3_24392 [Cephalotus follicularis]|uniref:Putative plant transposon protein domain-containing protein n=1 Tax=Cephalotus follicularis TaxID=3775 RepID=A0A1Q3CLF2_CEPFO|nr:hypothetical protein CFOL_v3_24392 [Cephalotus follicularis]
MPKTKRATKKQVPSSSQPKKTAKKQRLEVRESSSASSHSDSSSEHPVPIQTLSFVEKRVMGGRNIDYDFCSSEFVFVSWLENLHLLPLVQISNPFYTKLVKDFYSNLKMVSGPNEEFAITSVVKGQRMFLDARILASILHIPHTGIYVFEHKKWPEVEGFHPNQILSILYPNDPNVHPNMSLTTNRLSVDHRLLHHLIVHQILPTGGGYAKLSRMQVFIMWCILSKIEFCFPLLILKTMVRAYSQKKSVLPYGSLLTLIFLHYHIPLEGEISTKLKKEDTYNKSTLNRMGWKKEQGVWIYHPRADQAPRLAREEQEDNPPWEHDVPVPAASASAQTAPSSSSATLDRIMEMMQSLQDQFASMQSSFKDDFQEIKTRVGRLEGDLRTVHKDLQNTDDNIFYDLKVTKRRLKRMERKLAQSKTIDQVEETSGDDSGSDASTPAES